ncbi:hypothetical protein [Cupriavidus taiwanensis]|nr:hypothetical protein [Cupriavidus taiwanensis]SOY81891.1 hypothetical protein CBM2600_A120509 [Cupriavidus taiwanensis]
MGVSFPSGAVGNSPFGARNKIRNAMGNINQRGYVSGTATTGAGQYTIDDWRVNTVGQSLSYAASGNGFVLTAPAGGIEQTIEGIDIEAGTYYINWVGTATCTINGTPITKFSSVALPGNTNAVIRFSNGTVEKPQLELGGVTPFQSLPYVLERERSKRFLFVKTATGLTSPFGNGQCISTTQALIFIPISDAMRTSPSVVSFSNAGADFSLTTATGASVAVTGAVVSGQSPDGVLILVSVAGGLTANGTTTLIAANANARITMSAEF